MKLTWSQASNGNWNGKRGPYTLVTVAFHDDCPGVEGGWWVHPKLPGLKGKRVLDGVVGKFIGDRLFNEWLLTAGVIT